MDLYGTYPLPESQLDRFFMRLEIGYPERKDEAQIIIDDGHYQMAKNLPQIMNPLEVINLQESVMNVKINPKIVIGLLE